MFCKYTDVGELSPSTDTSSLHIITGATFIIVD